MTTLSLNTPPHSARPSVDPGNSQEKGFPITASVKNYSVELPVSSGHGGAWLTVAGSWMILCSTFGYLYAFGVYQDFYTRIYLSNHTSSQIAWIGSLQLAMPLLLGIFGGKLYDSGHYHLPEIVGSTIFTVSLFMLSLSKPQQYYQVFLSQGVGMGIGVGLVFTPTLSNISHLFYEKKSRALATGVALSGTSVGALSFPIMLNHLIASIGFAKAVRASAYIVLGLLVVGNCLVRRSKSTGNPNSKPAIDIKSFFAHAPYVVNIFAGILALLGLYFPLVFIQLYAVQHGIDPNLAFYSISIINGVSGVSRMTANFLADLYGPVNVIVFVGMITSVSIFLILAVKTAAALVVISILYGAFSGAWLSVALAAVGSMAKNPEELGARVGLCLAIESIALLVSAPIHGALLGSHFLWWRPAVFSGTMVAACTVLTVIVRHLLAKEKGTQKV